MAERTVDTVKLAKGGDYARVPARLKLFREDTANGDISTSYDFQDGGIVVFTARIVKDKSDPNSASATGHSYGKTSGVKDFEKLETIAVGRALALLGYLASGEVASFEEIEDFEREKKLKQETEILDIIEKMNGAKTLKQLREIWKDTKLKAVDEVVIAKNARKDELIIKETKQVKKTLTKAKKEITDVPGPETIPEKTT